MSDSFSMVEKYVHNKKSSIAIRPYLDGTTDNMGLQNYNLAVYDGVVHEEPITCLEINGVKRYLNGLNEFAPEVKALPEEERKSKIAQIRKVVSELEKEFTGNVIKVDDEDFWNKVTLLKPNNDQFWDQIKLRVGNDPVFLEPEKDSYDLIKLYAIEAGGFSLVAKSLEDAKNRGGKVKFYLDKLEDTASTKTELKKLRNKAGSQLDQMYNKNTNKLFYVAKVLDPDSGQYKKSTPNDILYDNMDRYINGELVDKNKRLCAERFIEVAALDMETLKLRAPIKDGAYYREIATKSDGFIWHTKMGVMLGRTPSDCLEFLKNPLNEEVLKALLSKIETYWNQ